MFEDGNNNPEAQGKDFIWARGRTAALQVSA